MASFFRRRRSGAPSRPTANRKPTQSRLSVEPLEERVVPATFFVSNTNDTGAGSFRQAVSSANNNTGTDDVVFSPGVIGNLDLASDVGIFESVNITGPGANQLTINQTSATDRIIQIGVPAAAYTTTIDVRITGLTFSGGKGGAGFNIGGGAIRANGSNLTLEDTQFLNNSTGSRGGALLVDSGNSAAGSVTIRNSTFGNNVSTNGGAIFFINPDNVTIENSTFSDNSSSNGFGGAISMGPAFTTATPPAPVRNGTGITLTNVTIAGNTAGNARGGGIYVESGNGVTFPVTIVNSIVAGNGLSDDVFGNVVTPASMNNVIGTNANNNFFDGQQGNQVGSVGDELDPLLGPLQENGGTTLTRALMVGSPAIDRGGSTSLGTDQRGQVRPAGAGFDVGAFELQQIVNPNPNPQNPPPTPGPAPSPPPSGSSAQQQNAIVLQSILFLLTAQAAGGAAVQIAGLTDFNGDGALDILVIAGRGRQSTLLVLSGANGLPIFVLPLR